MDTSGETSVDAELCEVCVAGAGGAVVVVAAAVADTEVAVVVDTCVVVAFVVATVVDFSGGDVVVVTVGNGAGVASVKVVTGGGIFTVFSAAVQGAVEPTCSLGGSAPTGAVAVTLTPSVGADGGAVTVFALAVVVTLADVVAGEGVQIGAGGFARAVPATETADTCACVAT